MKNLTMLLFSILISFNSYAWFTEDIHISGQHAINDKSLTHTDIEGAFGMKLGATYNQEFLKPSYDFNTGGNWVVPSKPIDILSRYQLFVDDRKVAWQIVGHGKVTTAELCSDELRLLVKVINKKYGTEKGWGMYFDGIDFQTEGYDNIIARNFRQGRSIEVYCKDLNLDRPSFRLTVIYRDDKSLYLNKEMKEKKRFDSWDI